MARLIARRDLSGLPRLLHPDAVFRSPMAHKPYAGAPVVSMILNTVLTVFEDFAYHRQLASADGRSVVLEFSARVGERELKGIDMIRFDDDGRIVDFEVMVRPMSGLQALGEEMGRRLASYLPRARPEAIAFGPRPDAAFAKSAASARRGELPTWVQRPRPPAFSVDPSHSEGAWLVPQRTGRGHFPAKTPGRYFANPRPSRP